MEITLTFLLFFFSIVLHEIAHGAAALYFGDDTAKLQGRLTLDPIKHIDPIMSILVPAACYFGGMPFLFGGAKPVPVNTLRLRRPRSDMKWIALAGPATNIGIALTISLAMHLHFFLLGTPGQGTVGLTLVVVMAKGILINCFLAFFNLIPLPPLDGGRIAVGLLPWHLGSALAKLEPYGLMILVALIYLRVTHYAFLPAQALTQFLLPAYS
ncbi:MAG: site-2 protease family protein [Planctomycetota bacterium]|jgi:Zn-dependent protease